MTATTFACLASAAALLRRGWRQGPRSVGRCSRGFARKTALKPADFGVRYDLVLGPPEVEVSLSVHGVRR